MTVLEIALLLTTGFFAMLSLLLLIALVVTAVFVIRYGRMVISWEQNIEDSLDRLDEAHQSMSRVLDKPLFSDSQEVRQVLADIGRCRDAVLWVANALTMPARPLRARDEDEQANG